MGGAGGGWPLEERGVWNYKESMGISRSRGREGRSSPISMGLYSHKLFCTCILGSWGSKDGSMHARTSQARGEIAPVSIARGVSCTHACLTLIRCGEWFTVLSAEGHGNIEEEGKHCGWRWEIGACGEQREGRGVEHSFSNEVGSHLCHKWSWNGVCFLTQQYRD